MELGHWQYPGDFEADDWFGFIYRIIDLDTHKEYIGKKQFWSTIRKPPLKGKKRKRVQRKESDWKSYTSSSTHVNEQIGIRGAERFLFLIESLHKSKAGLHYAEVETQILENVLRARLPDGERKFYNGMVGHMKFIPPDESPEEEAMRVRHTASCKPNTENRFFKGMDAMQLNEWAQRYRID